MTKNEYRIKEYDPVMNIWVLQKRFLRVFWKSISAGKKEKLQEYIEKSNVKK